MADAITKPSILQQLVEMMETGKLFCKVEQSVNRTIPRKDTLVETDKRLHFSQEEKKSYCEN